MTLKDLNDMQKEAVMAEGIVRVIAGAGSGKTRVLTYRIARLVTQCGTDPASILAVTFTRKAAAEMRERLKTLIGEEAASSLACGTFHSACYRILRETNGNGNGLRILDDGKRKAFLKRVLGPEGLNMDLEPGGAGAVISLAKNRLIDWKAFSEEAEGPLQRKLARAFREYEERKDRERLLDYDDLLFRCWKLLKSEKQVLRRYRDQFSHILVDEFQDTNPAQFEIVKLLTPPHDSLFVVGDDWQSIYGWRGAAPENIIEFEGVFPHALTVRLERNYRSTGSILSSAGRLIEQNRVRTDKKLWTENPDGPEVEVIEAGDADEEASEILSRIRAMVEENGPRYAEDFAPGRTRFRHIAVLYRTNAQSRALEDACIRHKVPYHVVGAPGFYDRREIKDITAFLRLVHDPHDDEALLRVINVPPRYLGRAFVAELESMAHAKDQSLFSSLDARFSRPYMGKSAASFRGLVMEWRHVHLKRNTSLPDLVKHIRHSTEYDRYICKDEEITPDDSRIQNLNELESAIGRFASIEDFLFYVEMFRARGREETGDSDRVSLMTLHKSKGLEFPSVFIAGCSQGLLPHQRSLDEGGIEEERRLCYVGMTRAMERLALSWTRTVQGKPAAVSQFVREAIPARTETAERHEPA